MRIENVTEGNIEKISNMYNEGLMNNDCVNFTGMQGISNIDDFNISDYWKLSLIMLDKEKAIGHIQGNYCCISQCINIDYLFLSKENRNKGYGKEIIKKLEDYYYNLVGKKDLLVSCYSNNIKGLEFYKKLGFKNNGTKEFSTRIKGEKVGMVFLIK